MNNQIYISLGSNLGNRKANIYDAFDAIEKNIGSIQKISSLYQSEPWGFSSKEYFINCVINIQSNLNAEKILTELHIIESNLGRIRTNTTNYSDRTIDLDLLYFGNMIIDAGIILPHPRLYQRKFVLIPMVEIAPTFNDPYKNRTILQLLSDCDDESILTKYEL